MVQRLVHELVQTTQPYLYVRGQSYYFRFIPSKNHRLLVGLASSEIRYSLRTKDLEFALYLMKRKRKIINLIQITEDQEQLEVLYTALNDQTLDVDFWVKSHISDVVPIEIQQRRSAGKEKQFTVGQAWQQFVATKGWTPKRLSTNQQMFDNVLYFLGDKAISEVSRSDVKSCLQSISELPRRNSGSYVGKSLSEIAKLAVPASDRISDKTVREHLKLLQGLFSTYLVKERELLKQSPTDGVRWAYEDSRFGSLSDTEIKRCISQLNTKPDWFQHLLLLAVYSGARRSELGRLRKSDVKICSDTGIAYFVVRQGKTSAAQRRVPIHSRVIANGFIEFVEGCTDLLFEPAAKNLNRITDMFGALLTDSHSEYGERLTFHSLRHSFVTKARSKGVEISALQEAIGHSKTGAGITDRYTHRMSLADIAFVIESVTY